MTARKLLLSTFALALFVATTADARPRPGGHLGGRRFEANKTFGLGFELGAPTSVVGKYFLASDRALDFGVGTIYNYFDRSGLHVYGDYLWHPVSLASTEDFELPLFIGIGARIWDFDNRLNDGVRDHAVAFGARVPVGISFDFNTVPLDVFVQIVPVLDFFSGYAAHTVFLDFDASIGVRYWFN
jgi:hypothetical protein